MKKINNLLLIFSIAFLSIKVYSQERIRVVNMIPRLLSGEINQDSEPNIAVNPSNISEIAASCFRGNPAIGSANAPIFISSDGGLTWNLNNIVPVVNPMNGTGDISIKFSPSGNSLYSGILTDNRQNIMNILKTDDPFSSNPMQSLITRANTDQPYVNVTTDATRQDWLFIGNNIFPPPPNGRSAAVEHSDAFFLRTIIERRNTSGQDRPSVRCASHSNGTVYGLFARTTNNNGVNRTCDVTVVRDDNFGTGIPFTALVGGDGNSGVIVATGVNMPFINAGGLGQHRLGSHMSTTVNPANSNEAFIAWTDRTGMVGTNLHVRQSIDNGVNWSGDLLNIPNGLNPAMAINSDGVIGVLYQQLVNGRREVHLQRSIDRINWTDLVLSNTPDNTPPPTFQPYLGDYIDLMCVGQNFYGVFSASNVPNNANFPQGVTYQRIANFATNQLIDRRGNTVNPSIDPFFFAIEPTNVFINSLNVSIFSM